MNSMISSTLLEQVIRIVQEQGPIVTKGSVGPRGSSMESTQKSSIGDLVTAVDVTVQEHLVRELGRLLPGSDSLGEESGLDDTRGHLLWIIDPVDGTTNLVHGLPHCGIAVGLYDSGEPVLGVVQNPFSRITYYAEAGRGSFERSCENPRSDRRLRVSDVRTLDSALSSFGLSYDRSHADSLFRVVAAVFERSQDLRRSGSAALDLVAVARGNLDLHIEPLSRPWDIAASSIILHEAGGVVTDWDGHEISWLERLGGSQVLASNRWLHEELIDVVQSATTLASRS